MADENVAKQVWKKQESWWRNWRCPSDYAVASYVEGTLGEKQRSRLEIHLTKCSRCRQIIGDTIKGGREIELVVPPITLFNKSVQSVPDSRVSTAWMLLPAGVAAIVVAVAAASIYLHHPEQGVVPPPHSLSAPLIAKSPPAPNPKSRVADVVRGLPAINAPLRITSPRAGNVLSNEPLQIRWTAMRDAGSYQVSVLAPDGDLVWKGETRELVLEVPASIHLKDGSYFVLVTSYLPNGRTVRSAPISFVVKR
jgi:hypothetical protein